MDDGVDCLPLIGSGDHLLEDCRVEEEEEEEEEEEGSSMTVSSMAGHQQAYLQHYTLDPNPKGPDKCPGLQSTGPMTA
ncbi:hypothetical protein NEUTE1DRAFT_140502 [Neurospora tetrasperma FGSC 2508]|uniref:Uncharacterized protein n=1 Tax=Neurospora tetrasperma (strain FGSC 2508 / ATCC MYA-4615 / P0657) TaxID=510951 RepID=F8MWP5_NEUT8|nr:uncharacterized protein NEUTE1DRAFT_140502 [Neurospora tetrasperma FGSC 2508]EGO54166.1 hypothetical protein NEUTE1DRAFT_140502 [Neurospora tetrasperma FGSC 2508]EGZ68405.1 hypothetical protein NEUTE2DRAFT_133061 [Neurospora tetrasperma FGSC 2509]